MSMPLKEAVDLWSCLPAPQAEELDGEYAGCVHHAGDPRIKAIKQDFFFNERSDIGCWKGKAYRPGIAPNGEGYNRWGLPGNRTVRNLRFATVIENSRIDGKPSLVMYYRAYKHWAEEIDLIDEIRVLGPGEYLGVYHTNRAIEAFTPHMRPDGTRSELEVFGLAGPIGEWIGVDDPALEVKSG